MSERVLEWGATIDPWYLEESDPIVGEYAVRRAMWAIKARYEWLGHADKFTFKTLEDRDVFVADMKRVVGIVDDAFLLWKTVVEVEGSN